MFKMGRSPRGDSNDNQPQGQPQQHSQPQPFAPPAAQTPHAQTRDDYERPQAHAPERAAASTPRAVTESEALARDLREGVVSGFVGAGTVVSGDAEFKGMLRIDGHFTGRVRSEKGSLIVSAGGKVDANIEVAAAKINGTVNGDIVAGQRVELGRSARVRGNLQTPALVIEEGAIFEGGCRMTQAKAEGDKVPEAVKPAETKVASETKAASRPEAASAKAPQTRPVSTQPAHQPAAQRAAVTANASKPTA
jgi:cytoskeletal protein CcmA (bactofilin family)